MDFLTEYGLYLAKLLTLLLFLFALAFGVGLLMRRARVTRQEQLEVKYLNDKFESMGLALKSAMFPRRAFKQALKEYKARRKRAAKGSFAGEGPERRRVFVINFKGDPRASAVASLREEISALLMVATPRDEVVVVLESPGGVVHGYGLAASQLNRIKEKGVPLTVAVDKVAASGGYMMACVADRILAAPFAIVGSIGVVGQLPNFNRALKNHDIDFELITAGEYKRTLTVFGENTEKGRAKFRQDIETTHGLFKDFVRRHRAAVDVDKVGTGEHWYGIQALDLKLVDAVRTSDDYLSEQSLEADLYQLRYVRRRSAPEWLLGSAAEGLARVFGSRWT